MQRAPSFVVVRVVGIVLLLLGLGVSAAAQGSPAPGNTSSRHPAALAFQALLPYGPVNTAVMAPGSTPGFTPVGSGWGAGLTLEWGLIPELRIFLDGNYATDRTQVGVAGQTSSSEWVFEMTSYSTHSLRFSEDAYFDRTATGFRTGLKAVLPAKRLAPWVGVGYGYYRWTMSYDTVDRSSTWGTASGYVWGLTYLAGVDWRVVSTARGGLFVRFYADLTAPAVFPVIDNLFNTGWTWDNSGGNNIMGAYRFGIAIGMPL